MKRGPAVALALALALASGGCGGSGRLSKAEYVRRADAACLRYHRGVERLPTPSNLTQLARFADRSLPQLDRALRVIRALKPPKEAERDVASWLAQTKLVRADVVHLRDAARSGDRAAVDRAFKRGSADDTRSNMLAATIGLRICSKP